VYVYVCGGGGGYSAVNGFWPVEFSNARLGANH
jgi:hypothetical protein